MREIFLCLLRQGMSLVSLISLKPDNFLKAGYNLLHAKTYLKEYIVEMIPQSSI